MKNNLSLPLAIIIAGLIIAGAVFYSQKSDSGAKADGREEHKEAPAKDPNPITDKDHVMGNPDARLAMIEFSDTECPYCKRFHATMNRIMDEYGKAGEVKWVYRHFPLDALHDKTRKEAEATECAADMGGNEKFWEYTNRLYEITPSNNGLDPKELTAIALYAGLDEKAFNECLESGKFAQKVEDDYQDGVKSGVRGTPHTVIIAENGDKISINGAFPYMEKTPGLFYRLGPEEKENFCSEETKLCGVKTAIDKLLAK